MKRTRPSHRVSLQDLLASSLLRPPVEMVKDYRGQRFVARLEADGTVRWNGRAYASLSEAASAAKMSHQKPDARGHPRVNGWVFWHIATSDGLVPIGDLREQAKGRGVVSSA